MLRRHSLRLPCLLLTVSILVVAPLAHAHGPTVQIVKGRVIEPAEIVIRVGQTVHFHNLDRVKGGHTLVADDGSFESPALGMDQGWHKTFDRAGSFAYHIANHPDAKGVVVVEAP